MRPLRTLAGVLTTAASVALMPARTAACAVCIGSVFGDRSYTWPYLGLILMPFIVAGTVIAVLAWQFGWRPRRLAARLSAALRSVATLRRAAAGDPSPRTHTETT